jgi:hypothetical protein
VKMGIERGDYLIAERVKQTDSGWAMISVSGEVGPVDIDGYTGQNSITCSGHKIPLDAEGNLAGGWKVILHRKAPIKEPGLYGLVRDVNGDIWCRSSITGPYPWSQVGNCAENKFEDIRVSKVIWKGIPL